MSEAVYNVGLGLVAQSVEQRIENPCVGGSIPPRATIIRGVAHESVLRFSVTQSSHSF